MFQFRDVLSELLIRLRGSRAAAFLPKSSAPPAPAPAGPQPPRWPPRPPLRLPPLPEPVPPRLPLQAPPPPPHSLPAPQPPAPQLQTAPLLGRIYPRETTTWGAEGGWAPTTSGFETRVYEPPRQTPKVPPQQLAFSVFDGLFDD